MSDTFTRYLCWRLEDATNTINTEAVSPPRSVFLATHAPLRIRRSKLNGGTRADAKSIVQDSSTVDERVVLKDFLGHNSDTGALLVPVVGDSGSGKSHLVRWVGEQLPQTERRKVIYLEKGKTSLKAVIRELLADLDTDRGAVLQGNIERFSESRDTAALARELLNSLEEELAATTSQGHSGTARALRGPKGLAVIFQDPYVREYMLQPGRFIPQMADRLLHDREDNGERQSERFTTGDLPVNFEEIRKTAEITRHKLGMLSSMPELQGAAVDLLNDLMESAVKKSFNLGAGSLVEAMAEVRREYAARGQEIVLLIEDFALIQGMQRELLDAMIEPAKRDGKEVLARMRTMMAVTTGYFQDLPETVLTRLHATLGYVYDLDAPFSEEDTGDEYIASFAARYLNAARVGLDALDTSVSDVPNKCDQCRFKDECHSSFGASAEGFGLYPFNRSALRRAVHSTAPAENQYRFVPRAVLGGVIKPVLIEYGNDIADGQFPPQRFRADFKLTKIDQAISNTTLARIDQHHPEEAERHALFVEFWGDAEDVFPAESMMRRAFSLAGLRSHPGVEDSRPAREEPSPTTRTATPPADPQRIPEALTGKLHSIEEWATREVPLSQDLAREIRTIIAEAVVQRYTWTDPLMRELTKTSGWERVWDNKGGTVFIELAKGQLAANAENAPVKFPRTAANSLFFQAILRAKHGYQHSGAEIRRLASLAEQAAVAFTSAMQAGFTTTDGDLVLGLRASLIGAVLAGHAWPGMNAARLLDAALDDGQAWTRADLGNRVPAWSQTLLNHLEHRPDLVKQIRDAAGVSQGTGAPKLIDAARLLPLLEAALKSWDWSPDQNAVPSWVMPAVKGFSLLPKRVDDQFTVLSDTLATLRSKVSRGSSGSAIVAAVREAMSKAKEVGLPLPVTTAKTIDAMADQAETRDWSALSGLEDDLNRALSANEDKRGTARLVAAALDRGDHLAVISQFLAESERWLDEALTAASLRTGGNDDTSAQSLKSLIAEWQDIAGAKEGDHG